MLSSWMKTVETDTFLVLILSINSLFTATRSNLITATRSLEFFRFLSFLKPSTGEGKGTPLQYSCLENPMDGRAWKAAVHGVSESDFTFAFHFHAWEKEMATHSNVLAWRIPGTGEPGGLPAMGSHRVGHD